MKSGTIRYVGYMWVVHWEDVGIMLILSPETSQYCLSYHCTIAPKFCINQGREDGAKEGISFVKLKTDSAEKEGGRKGKLLSFCYPERQTRISVGGGSTVAVSAVALAKSRPIFTAFSGIPGKIEKQITFIEQIHHAAQSPTIYLVRIK